MLTIREDETNEHPFLVSQSLDSLPERQWRLPTFKAITVGFLMFAISVVLIADFEWYFARQTNSHNSTTPAPTQLPTHNPTTQKFQFQLNGTWSSDKPWIWTDVTGEKWGENQPKSDKWNKNLSIIFYGSSHIRELYFSQIRIETNVSIHTDLSKHITHIPSGYPDEHGNRTICDPHRTGYTNGLYGLDLKHCGNPGFRLVGELSNKTVIGFKTFLHTPEADALFLQRIQQKQLGNPDVLLVDIGIWGARGERMKGDLSVAQEIL